jgi:hypothetical protein
MVEKISRQALDNYFACKFKAHLAVSGERGVPSEYLNMARDAGFSFALAEIGQLLILAFKLLLFRRSRTDEPGGPPLFEPSLKIGGISAISNLQGFLPGFIGPSTLRII